MDDKDITFLTLIIFFCVCSVLALVFNAHSKSRVPLLIFAASAISVIVFSVSLLLNDSDSSSQRVRDYIPLTSAEQSETEGIRKKTQESAKSDDDTVYITKNGTKYHFSADCGDYELYECTLRQAKERGLEPCRRCAQ